MTAQEEAGIVIRPLSSPARNQSARLLAACSRGRHEADQFYLLSGLAADQIDRSARTVLKNALGLRNVVSSRRASGLATAAPAAMLPSMPSSVPAAKLTPSTARRVGCRHGYSSFIASSSSINSGDDRQPRPRIWHPWIEPERLEQSE